MNRAIFTLKKMKSDLVIFSLALLFSSQLAHSAAISGSSGAFDAIPPAIQTPDAKPIVMLALSNDHQLFSKAYTDYDDIIKADGTIGEDGLLETNYTDNFDYYGYFDPRKCYEYNLGSARFDPKAMAAGPNNHHCEHTSPALSRWSGNFLNWLTMSRMDILRKVLYGGKRIDDTVSNANPDDPTDTAVLTILERAHIPSDNHAWSKTFSIAADLHKYTPYIDTVTTPYPNGLTFCNVTPRGATEFSESNTQPPLLRVASGSFPFWAAQEGAQCLWPGENGFASPGSPGTPIATYGNMVVRVKVCDSALFGTENCKNYGKTADPVYKPVGLLHTYGENGSMDFGLISGSYEKNKSGGVLRKNISPFTDEINADGTFNTTTNGIISTINRFRISRYSYDEPGYHTTSPDNCKYGQNTWADGACSNWGNPMGEIYLEALRYYSGAAAGRTEFAAPNDATWISGLATGITWRDPYSAAQTAPIGGGYKQCSKPNVIAISTGVLGFDNDQYLGAADVGGTLVVDTETNFVGASEAVAGNTYYVGSAATANAVCTAQTIGVNDLSGVTGLCPEAAGLLGSYKMAGLAYYAHKDTTDLRGALTGTQNVNTYSIALAPPIPDIKVNVNGKTVRIIPIGHNWRDNNAMVLVNFQVISQTATSGEFFLNFENAPAGADYDSDFIGYLKYTVSGGNISIVGYNLGASAGSLMHLGYVIDGVTDPGYYNIASNHFISTNNQGFASFSAYSFGPTDTATIDGACSAHSTTPISGTDDPCRTNIADGTNDRDSRVARTHTAGTSTTGLLKSPMWYAAKWGNFNDLNNNGTPDLVSEWDVQDNNTGAYTPDGIPDSYYLVTNPKVLETQLGKTLNDILQRASSGTAAAVIADTVSMTGAVVQALYQPRMSLNGDLISWAGLVHSVFIDEYGNLREDTDQNGALTAADKFIQIKYSADVGRTQIYYCTTTDGGLTLSCPTVDRKEVEDMLPLWNVRDQLARISDARIATQRLYTAPFMHSTDSGRHIITWLDNDADNLVDAGETVAFTTTSITNTNHGYLNSTTEAEADDIVNFIRGKEGITGFRSRTIDYDSDTVKEAWRLGDIVHSTPLIVAQPGEKWDVLYGDETYTTFRTQYKDRRSVVYVGANDGMLHAINAGFFDPSGKRFCRLSNCVAATDDNSHPLGAELWGYVPKNLLPHLRWLTEADYPHVFYMDGKSQAYDVNIFPDDAVHPGGWGTILVAGMRLGGGDLAVDINNDATTDYTAKSGYVILDITDPEAPPIVLGEFTHADLGYSTSVPSLVVRRQPDDAIDWSVAGSGLFPNDWYLVFGTGPNVLSTVTSTQNAKLFSVKLKLDATSGTLDFATAGNVSVFDTAVLNSYVGDPVGVDWSVDFLSDAIYFGIVGGTPTAPDGRLMRMKVDDNDPINWDMSTMLNSGQPFVSKPEVASIDAYPTNEWWIYAGTGRLYVNDDNTSTSQQSFYGINEAHDITYPHLYPDTTVTMSTSNVSADYIQNVTGISVFADNSVTIPLGIASEFPAGTDLFTELETHIKTKRGWFFNYSASPVATRSLTKATYWRKLTLFTSYTPPTDTCTPEGYSELYAVYHSTGTAHPTAGLNLTGTLVNNGASDKVPSTYLSIGIASEITTYDTLKGTKPIIQMSTGEIVDTDPLTGLGIGDGRQSWRELPL